MRSSTGWLSRRENSKWNLRHPPPLFPCCSTSFAIYVLERKPPPFPPAWNINSVLPQNPGSRRPRRHAGFDPRYAFNVESVVPTMKPMRPPVTKPRPRGQNKSLPPLRLGISARVFPVSRSNDRDHYQEMGTLKPLLMTTSLRRPKSSLFESNVTVAAPPTRFIVTSCTPSTDRRAFSTRLEQ